MWIFTQILIDIIFALGLIVLAAAHIAGRSIEAEFDVFREFVDGELDKLRGKS